MDLVSRIKLLMLACVSPFALWLAWGELSTALAERAPTKIAADSFANDYHGERWLEVAGRVAVEHARHEKNKNGRYITAPVVANDWTSRDPVHVLVSWGPLTSPEIASWPGDVAELTSVRGMLRGGLAPKGEPEFGGLEMGEPFVHLNEGGEPNLWGSVFMALLFGLGALASGGFVVSELRARRVPDGA